MAVFWHLSARRDAKQKQAATAIGNGDFMAAHAGCNPTPANLIEIARYAAGQRSGQTRIGSLGELYRLRRFAGRGFDTRHRPGQSIRADFDRFGLPQLGSANGLRSADAVAAVFANSKVRGNGNAQRFGERAGRISGQRCIVWMMINAHSSDSKA